MDKAATSAFRGARKRKRAPFSSTSTGLPTAQTNTSSSPERKKSVPCREEVSMPELKELEQSPEVHTYQSSFRLFDLPVELWLKIGQMAVDEDMRNLVAAANLPGSTGPYVGDLYPAITHSCKRLRQELVPYYYKSVPSFCIEPKTGSIASTLGNWLKATDPKYRSFLTLYTIAGAVNKDAMARCWCDRKGMHKECADFHVQMIVHAHPYSEVAFTEWVRTKLQVEFDVVSRRLDGEGDLQKYVDTIAFK